MIEKRARGEQVPSLARKYVPAVSPEISRGLAAKKFQQLNRLVSFFAFAGPEADWEIALNMALEVALGMVKYDRAILYLEEMDTGRLRAQVTQGFGERFPASFEHGNLFSTWTMLLGKPLLIPDERESEVKEPLSLGRARSMLSVPLFKAGRAVGNIQLFSSTRNFFSKEDAQLIWILAVHLENLLARIEELEIGQRLGIVDLLTGTYNRNYFDQAIKRELNWAVRKRAFLSLLMLDLDDFQKFNERHTHTQGDLALKEVGMLLRRECRQSDIPARHESDQFAVILPETDEPGALVMAKRLNLVLAKHHFPAQTGEKRVSLTASIGTSTFPTDAQETSSLIQGAVQSLTKAKEMGRNQLLQFSQLPFVEIYPKFYCGPAVDFNRVAQGLRLVFDLDRLLELAVQVAREAANALRCSLMVKDEATGDLNIKVAQGIKFLEPPTEVIRVKSEDSIAGWVAKRKTPLVTSNIKEVMGPRTRNGRNYLNNSCMVVPLMAGGQTLGVINLSNKANREIFTQEDLDRFMPLARVMADFLHKGFRFQKEQADFALPATLALARMAEAKLGVKLEHSTRVARYAVAIARELALPPAFIKSLKFTAHLHDIGLMCLNEDMLRKPAKFTQVEMTEAKKHPMLGGKLLGDIPFLKKEQEALLLHHERLDGSGYPYGKSGDEIPLAARILSVADVFEAMTANRPHRRALSKEEALNEILTNAGTKYDSRVARSFSRII